MLRPDRRFAAALGTFTLGVFLLAGYAAGQTCDDGNACTLFDRCEDGICVLTATIECEEPADPCMQAFCNPASGACIEIERSCDDGNPCTEDTCQAGVGCMSETISDGTSCADTNPCTENTCMAGVCEATNVSGACDDGNLCTEEGTCVEGTCFAAPVVCEPSNDPCMPNECNPTNGECEEVDRDAECAALSTASPCLDFECNPQVGICVPVSLSEFDGSACDDSNSCTQNDRCQSGVCLGAAASSPSTGAPVASAWMLGLLALCIGIVAARRVGARG
jgi:hypothetical protein